MNIANLSLITDSLVDVFMHPVSLFILQHKKGSQFIPLQATAFLSSVFCVYDAACYQLVIYTRFYQSTSHELKKVNSS